LDMFPYPSGAGLHVGHPEGYTGRLGVVFRRLFSKTTVLSLYSMIVTHSLFFSASVCMYSAKLL
jgi:hypothetical protein